MYGLLRRSSLLRDSRSAGKIMVCLSLLLVFICTPVLAQDEETATVAVDRQQALADWATAAAIVKEWSSALCCQHYFDKDPQGFVDRWIPFKAKFDPFWADFTSRYGSRFHEITAAFEGISQPLNIEQGMNVLANELPQIPDHDKNVAQWASSYGENSYREWLRDKENPPHPHKVELMLNRAERAYSAFSAALKLDPENVELKERVALSEEAVTESRTLFEKNLSHPDLNWKGDNPEWSGEGDPDRLCAAAMDFLKKNPDRWGDAYLDDPAEPVAIYLAGKDWKVWKEAPLTLVPTQYSLDFGVAFQGKKDKKIAYHYHYTFYTKEEAGVQKAPPFHYANPHQYAHYKMLSSNIPSGAMKAAAKASSTSSAPASADAADTAGRKPTGGFRGILFRLLLSLALILGGLVAAGSLIKEKVPAMQAFFDSVDPRRAQIGVGLLIIGVLFFLRATFLYWSPLTDLLPQAAAVLLGLFLGWELLLLKSGAMKKTAGPAGGGDTMDQARAAAGSAAQKAHDMLEQHAAKVRQLQQKQVPIGIASIVIGLIHLMIGGAWLF